jgi:type II secretory pathway component PulM
MSGREAEQPRWRRRLRRELAALIALKLVALALLWWLFFSPAHRTVVDADAAGRRLGMAEAAARIESAAKTESAAAAPAPQAARRD